MVDAGLHSNDPEVARALELLRAQQRGELDAAGEVELEMYADRPGLVETARAQLAREVSLPGASDDRAWLERARQDQALQRSHATGLVAFERRISLTFFVASLVTALFNSGASTLLLAIAATTFFVSLARQRLAGQRDPYDNIRQ